MSTKVTIDIWSDVMCPWCLIGYRQLENALDQLDGEIAATIRWHAFELNPDMPETGEEQVAHLARKYGRTPEQASEVRGQMRAIADRAGAQLDYRGEGEAPPAMMWNTFLAHKLLAWALAEHGPERQTALKLALFAAHFEQRRQIGDRDVLLDIAAEQGFDRAAAAQALGDEQLSQYVRMEEQQAYDANITGVPAMVIEGKYLVPGAQEPDVYVSTLRRVVEREGLAA